MSRTQIYRTGDAIRSINIGHGLHPSVPFGGALSFYDVSREKVAAAVDGLRKPSRRSPVFYSPRYAVATLALAHDDIIAVMPDLKVTETLADIALDRSSPLSYRLIVLEAGAVRTFVQERDPEIVQQWSRVFTKYEARRRSSLVSDYDPQNDPEKDLLEFQRPVSPEESWILTKTALGLSLSAGMVFSVPAVLLAFNLPIEVRNKGFICGTFPLLIAAAGYYPIRSLLAPKEPIPASRRRELLTQRIKTFARQIAGLDGAIAENLDPERTTALVKIRAALDARRTRFQQVLDVSPPA